MAAGFKSATVTAAKVPSTQTDFPSYVDLSRLGITTLAEAQSVRVYADSAKTTEWAREIVSATEMHVKVPSLTSTVVMYVDWDGVRADYAVTDTYGRNAVWSDYSAVYHLQSLTADSTSNNRTLTNNGTVTNSTGKIGDGANIANTNTKYLNRADTMGVTATSNYTMQIWFNLNSSSSTSADEDAMLIWVNGTGTNGLNTRLLYEYNGGSPRMRFYRLGTTNGFADASGSYADNTWHKFVGTYDGTTVSNYIDNLAAATASSGSGGINVPAASEFVIGQFVSSSRTVAWDGVLDESRVRLSALSANWITTEYNNQSDESTFWGTWTTVAGGTTPSRLLMMGVG